MSLNLIIQINNSNAESYSSPVRVIDGNPTLSWQFDFVNRVLIDPDTGVMAESGEFAQESYEIRIATNSINIGSDSFIANMSKTGIVTSQIMSWVYDGNPIERGNTYYGQLRVTDELGRSSAWYTFSFRYNSLPVVDYIFIEPLAPTIDNDLTLNYSFSDDDNDSNWEKSIIRWYKNGVYQKDFDNFYIVQASYLQVGDIWGAYVYPHDGYEYGERVAVSSVKISIPPVVLSNVQILPLNPNENDILTVAYDSDNFTAGGELLTRWYINNRIYRAYSNLMSIKPDVSVGDTVRVEVKHESSLSYFSSSEVEIGYSDFVVTNIKINGKENPLDVSTLNPIITWRNFVPSGKEVNYVSIKIGTFYESDNIYSSVFAFERESFTIPSYLLNKGRDYYISVAISDTEEFSNYQSAHFRIIGSRWDLNVDNSKGWTLEVVFKTETKATYNYDDFQVLRINDGSRFGEIRLYADKIVLASGDRIEYSHDNTEFTFMTVGGYKDDIKIYIDRELVIDGSGIFTQATSEKKLEMGCSNNSGFVAEYKYMVYTTEAAYYPGATDKYTEFQLHTFLDFEDNEIVALHTYANGRKIFAVKPDSEVKNSIIYSILAGNNFRCGTTARTFFPINNIKFSPDLKKSIFAHAGGITIMNSYSVGLYDSEVLFIDDLGQITNILPEQQRWEKIQNASYTVVSFDDYGLNINTIG